MKDGYDAKHIEVLDAITHIQLNPNMYISTTENSSHLIEEALDNALDEAQAGHASIIAVTENSETGEYSIMDNGRGIPIENDTAVIVSTELFSGAKFSGIKQAYKISCFVKSTNIFMHSELSKLKAETIGSLAENKTKFYGVSVDDDGEFVRRLMYAEQTGETADVMFVSLSNTYVEVCTPEHLWMDISGDYIQTCDLVAGTELKNYNSNYKKLYVVSVNKMELQIPLPVYDVYSPIDSNFVLESGAVVHNSGLHGVGLVAIYALSSKYDIEIYRDNKHAIYNFENCILVNKKVEKLKATPDNIPFSTKISFKPNDKYFTTTKPDFKRIRAKLNVASVDMPDLTLVLMRDDKKDIIKCDLDEFFESEVKTPNDKETTERIDLEFTNDSEKMKVSLCFSFDGPVTPKCITAVNLLPIKQNGSHSVYFLEILRNYFSTLAKKSEYHFLPGDANVGLRCYFSLSMTEPKFKGQSKERLENSREQLKVLLDGITIQLDDYFKSNPDSSDNILNHFHLYRKKLESKTSKIKTKVANKFTKLRDCKSRDGELFVVEGESAAGGIIQCRGTSTKVAVLPLKGKIPSIVNKKDMLANLEIKELFQALGTGVEPDFNLTNMRYEKLICCCDADPDGGHIAVLLTMVIAIMAPEIIKSGRYYIANTPLYGTRIKKEFVPIWSNEQLDKAAKDKLKIFRFKGLGEFNPIDLKECLLNEQKRSLTQIRWDDEVMADLILLLKDSSVKRKLVEDFETDYEEAYDRIDNFIRHNYRKYGNHVNMERMIPFYADGLRPVERRVLFSAYEMAKDKFAKSATIVGHAMRYHPHGDCLHGNTRVLLTNGEIKTIRQLYKDQQDVEVYAFDPSDGRFKYATATNFRIGQRTKRIYNIYLNNGSIIKCTNNHPFYIFDKGWVKAEKLVYGDVFLGMTAFLEPEKNTAGVNLKLCNLYCRAKGMAEYKSTLLSLWELYQYEQFTIGMVRHHIDKNRLNNNSINLDLITRAEHAKIHVDDGFALEALAKGRETMKSDPIISEYIKNLNKQKMAIINKHHCLLKAFKVLDYLNENEIDINEVNYVLHRDKVYNGTYLNTLKEKGYFIKFEELIDLHDVYKHTSFFEAIGGNLILKEQQSKDNHCGFADDFDFKTSALNRAIIHFILSKAGRVPGENEWDRTLDLTLRDVGARGQLHLIDNMSVYGSYKNYLNETIQQIFTFVEKIEIEETTIYEPMYDFTVNGLENMLIVGHETKIDGKQTIQCVVAHNSSIYGTLCQLVGQNFMTGQGNFGTNLGVEKIGAAAPRYTEARLSRSISMAFEFMKFAPMVEGEMKGYFEPEYIPTPFPFCLFSENYITGIGFGVKTTVPTYDIGDLFKRLMWLIGERKSEPIIYPKTFGCKIIPDKQQAIELLTTGKGIIKYRGVIDVSKTKRKAILRSIPPNISFSKIEKAVLGKEFLYMDQSSGEVGTQIEFVVDPDRKRKVDDLFKTMVKLLEKCVTSQISFLNYQIDLVDNKAYVLKIMSVDIMLLKTYELYVEHFTESITSQITKIESDIYTLDVLAKIRDRIPTYFNNGSDYDDAKVAALLSKLINEPEDFILDILRKYTISKILRIKIDKVSLDKNLKNLNIIKNDIKKNVVANYKEFNKKVLGGLQ